MLRWCLRHRPDVVADAMRSRVNVDSERLLVQWQTTLVTSETVDMVRVAHRTQHLHTHAPATSLWRD